MSKLDRWKRISAGQTDQPVNKNKPKLVDDLSRVKEDVVTGSEEAESTIHTEEVGVESKSIKLEYKTGVDEKEEVEPAPTNQFVSRVSKGIREAIDSKITKADTHKKTSFLLNKDTLNKLANYDRAMGGRIQGIFVNDLLDSFFEELEQDEMWKNILNRKIY